MLKVRIRQPNFVESAMNVGISSENAQFLQAQVAAGSFASPEEALNAAVNLLRRHEALRAKIQRGCEQLDRGEFLEFDDDGLAEYFEKMFGADPRRDTGE
jgi:Arc/MetJ-type ribon-helix-helix transcriptional regulator